MRSLCMFCVFAMLFIFPCIAKAQFQCEDISTILKTEMEIRKLQEKYASYLRTKYNASCQNYFYGAFIQDDVETIFQCMRKGDQRLIAVYMDYMLASKGSADESVPGYFGMLYLERKRDIFAVLREYPLEDVDYLLDVLGFDAFYLGPAGLLNVDIEAIRKELDDFRSTLRQKQECASTYCPVRGAMLSPGVHGPRTAPRIAE